jgi:hypothetical protein
MSLNQDESREWTVVLRITEHPGLGDHPWWTPGKLCDALYEKLTAIQVDEMRCKQVYLDQDLDEILNS